MKLEAMDRRNPQLLRPATVTRVDGHTLHLTYDGWPPVYDVSVEDDDYDIHPVGWCAKTGHPLQVPPGERSAPAHVTDTSCPTPGCTGVGHIKGPRYANHHRSATTQPIALTNEQRANSHELSLFTSLMF